MGRTFFLLCALTLMTAACQRGQTGGQTGASSSDSVPADSQCRVQPRYAEGFQVQYMADGVRLVDISDPQGKGHTVHRFALVPDGLEAPQVPEGYTPVTTPVRSVVCMTSLQLSNFICLGALDRVTGVNSTRHLHNAQIKRQLKDGHTAKIGIEGNFDPEVVMALDPQVIFISPSKRGGYDALEETGLPLVPHLGYQETTPLGQAEWIKFIALFTGQELEANTLFDQIEQRYDSLCALTRDVQSRPVVLSGEQHGGIWYAVGGRSFLAQLFRDAGADYFMKDDNSTGGVNLDFETVYAQAADAPYWRIMNSFDGDFSYDDLLDEDPRYADFRAWREHGVLYCNMRQVPYYERMPVEPDVVLADLIHAFHPDILPDHNPVFYHLLK